MPNDRGSVMSVRWPVRGSSGTFSRFPFARSSPNLHATHAGVARRSAAIPSGMTERAVGPGVMRENALTPTSLRVKMLPPEFDADPWRMPVLQGSFTLASNFDH